MKEVTIKDIAQKLQLSVSTISRALNDTYDIRPETRELILKTAASMGYRPNPIARKLKKKRSFNIGIIVPEFENSFFPKVIMGAQSVLHSKGYQVLVMQSEESWEIERKNVNILAENRVDGIIISLSSEDQNKDLYQELIKVKLPLVFFNRVHKDINAPKVVFDDYKWSYKATKHLLNQGIRNIYFLGSKQKLSFSENRAKGYIDALKEYGISTISIKECGFTVEDGEKITKNIIESGKIPEAIFASSDLSAIGVMNVLKKEGIKIPSEVCVVGFSDSVVGRYVTPSLTSVSQPTTSMGAISAQLLLQQINNGLNLDSQTVLLDGELKIRESSLRVKTRDN